LLPRNSLKLEHDVLRALPQGELAERAQILAALGDGQEMIAGELADLAAKIHRAVSQQDLGFADAAGIEDDLARRRMAGGVLVSRGRNRNRRAGSSSLRRSSAHG
jgi:hypothetical protein